MAQNQLGKFKQERGFIERVLDGSGAAVGTGLATKSLLMGASGYSAAALYLASYITFKAAKGAYHLARNPIKNLNYGGIRKGIHDLYAHAIPYRDKVPASVGVVSAGVNYWGSNLASYLA